ncbi:MAG TPA: choice-of-anchor tandem repeat GloVer-containing protein [Stellaceae bacterium]|nr:choice-of-anchor tandem repeat GloVer-containing protein [Stellaceae bacterium]
MRIGTGRKLLLLGILAGAWLTPWHAARAYTFKTIHDFCSWTGCRDGQNPESGLVMDAAGKLYGTTGGGGAAGHGVAYKLTPDPVTGRWTEMKLHDFCTKSGCPDGSGVYAGLTPDDAGGFYGMTQTGGSAASGGTAFRLTPDQGDLKWSEKVLHSFCATGTCTDGFTPWSGLTTDTAGNLYGTTYGGGTAGTSTTGGTVFRLAAGAWSQEVLYNFCSASKCRDGQTPLSGVSVDAGGNVFGFATGGGREGAGTAFELTYDPGTGSWTQTVIHDFCIRNTGAHACMDGDSPNSTPVLDAAGNVYGTTVAGGTGAVQLHGTSGIVFRLSRDPATGAWTTHVLHNFCSWNGSSACTDGALPNAIVMDPSGTRMFGTAAWGGTGLLVDGEAAGGVVFELAYDPATGAWVEHVLHNFCRFSGCPDGYYPAGGVIMDTAGNLYGTALLGGHHGGGKVFELVNE